MSVPDGYTDVPSGKLAEVVTFLEILHLPPASRPQPPEGFTLRHAERPDPEWYRGLFRKVGSRWLWFSRLRLSDKELTAITHDPLVEVYALQQDEEPVGLLELDFRAQGQAELAYLGVIPECIGVGAGRFLIETAIARAAEWPVKRLWVHTCTHDHPAALRFYQRAGFRAYRRAIEVMDDPRLSGELPRDAAPDIPLLDKPPGTL